MRRTRRTLIGPDLPARGIERTDVLLSGRDVGELTCLNFDNIGGYYCSTSADECASHADCPSCEGCMYDLSLERWVCREGVCLDGPRATALALQRLLRADTDERRSRPLVLILRGDPRRTPHRVRDADLVEVSLEGRVRSRRRSADL